MHGGELFVPKIPSMNIMDLAQAIAPECETKIVGIRPGEKLHEVMITEDDARKTLEFDSFYVIQPEFPFWHGAKEQYKDGKECSDGFRYSSEINKEWLSIDALQTMISSI
jgi:UDP-N-acetylglucosamine 4,6-dehydratase